MAKTLTLIAVLVALVAPSGASAGVSKFKVSDRGDYIRFAVTVCARGHVDFRTYLHTDAGVAPTYTADWRGGSQPGVQPVDDGPR